jgi:hypothetical protein
MNERSFIVKCLTEESGRHRPPAWKNGEAAGFSEDFVGRLNQTIPRGWRLAETPLLNVLEENIQSWTLDARYAVALRMRVGRWTFAP